jgi:hypothetical protein
MTFCLAIILSCKCQRGTASGKPMSHRTAPIAGLSTSKDLIGLAIQCPRCSASSRAAWWNGRHWGLKIPWGVNPVWVRIPPRPMLTRTHGDSINRVRSRVKVRVKRYTKRYIGASFLLRVPMGGIMDYVFHQRRRQPTLPQPRWSCRTPIPVGVCFWGVRQRSR